MIEARLPEFFCGLGGGADPDIVSLIPKRFGIGQDRGQVARQGHSRKQNAHEIFSEKTPFSGEDNTCRNHILRPARPRGSRTAGVGVSQDLRASAPLRAERTGHRRLQKKGFPAALDAIRAGLPARTEIELWFQDEARVGQKNSITRRWAKRGTRPRARMTNERNGRTSSARSARRRARAPRWSCLGATRRRWPPPGRNQRDRRCRRHAVLMLDQAGWHMSSKLAVPDNITLLPLPPDLDWSV